MLVILKTTLKTASGTLLASPEPQEISPEELDGLGPSVFELVEHQQPETVPEASPVKPRRKK